MRRQQKTKKYHTVFWDDVLLSLLYDKNSNKNEPREDLIQEFFVMIMMLLLIVAMVLTMHSSILSYIHVSTRSSGSDNTMTRMISRTISVACEENHQRGLSDERI